MRHAKNALLLRHGAQNREKEIAELVPELAERMGLRPAQMVSRRKSCNGLDDAPRHWWLTLQKDVMQKSWKPFQWEACLMSLRVKKIVRNHLQPRGRRDGRNNPQSGLFKSAMSDIHGFREKSPRENGEFEMRGCRRRPHNNGFAVEQTH